MNSPPEELVIVMTTHLDLQQLFLDGPKKKILNSLPPVAYNDHIYKYQNIYFDRVDSTLYFQQPCPRNNHFYIG